MLIGDNWKIVTDSLNVTLYFRFSRRRKNTGENFQEWKADSYYFSVKNALHALIDKGISETELKDLQVVVAKIDELHSFIESLPDNA